MLSLGKKSAKLKVSLTLLRKMLTSEAAETTVQPQKIDVQGQTINYVAVGQGIKYVLCLPGALGNIWSDFKPQIEGFDSNKFTIVAWDPPGFGYSRPPDRKFGVKFYEEDANCALQFMKQLGINKFSLLGWSAGGVSSIILAAKYPENVEKLVLWGTNVYLVKEDLDACRKLGDVSEWSEKMKAPLIALYTEKGLEAMWKDWCDTVFKIYENGGKICDEALKNIVCPTLILHGDKDPMIAPEHPGFLLKHIKMAKLHRYPDGKHNIHLKYAKDFNKRVSEFLLQ